MFAAVNTVEPPILELVTARVFEVDKPWSKERLPLVEDRVRNRLTNIRTSPLMSPAAKRGLPTSELSTLNGRLTPARHRPADVMKPLLYRQLAAETSHRHDQRPAADWQLLTSIARLA
jgi:hypothetical protein